MIGSIDGIFQDTFQEPYSNASAVVLVEYLHGHHNYRPGIKQYSCQSSSWSRETGSAVPSRISPLILHTQVESVTINIISAYS